MHIAIQVSEYDKAVFSTKAWNSVSKPFGFKIQQNACFIQIKQNKLNEN